MGKQKQLPGLEPTLREIRRMKIPRAWAEEMIWNAEYDIIAEIVETKGPGGVDLINYVSNYMKRIRTNLLTVSAEEVA